MFYRIAKLTILAYNRIMMTNIENTQKNSFKRILFFFTKTKKRLVLTITLLVLVALGVFYFSSFDAAILTDTHYSTTFFDRKGKPLRTFFSEEETYSKPCRISEVSPHFLRAIVLIEDKSFYSHHGVVLSSLGRAVWQNIKGKGIISGGSTITMQTVKLVYHHNNRNIFNKLAEIFGALKLEMHLSKTEILEAYLNRLPFGNMIYGVKQAARYYFGKDPSQLSLNQAIYLALIPKSPSRYNPAKHMNLLKKRWDTILEIFKQRNHISHDEYLRARNEGITFEMNRFPFLAPHFIELVKERFKDKELPEQVYTTLDYDVQKEMEGIVREHIVRLTSYDVSSAAVVIIDNITHQVIGFLGGPDYFSQEAAGNVNLAVALRQPGSTLKPFVYGLALESGYTPASIIPDIKFPSRGGFFPKNHDGREHGPLRLRNALACSYNIPAFYLAMKLTPRLVIQKLNKAGFSSLQADPGFYGETIALGSGEVRLLNLTAAYSAFANHGILYSPVFVKNEPVTSTRIFTPITAFLIWDILADPSARFASFGYESSMNLPFPVAIKTGTSKGFRDKWAIGTNARYTVGVWMGNPSGKNMQDTSDTGSAATILRDIFLALQKDWTSGDVHPPAGMIKLAICPLSGELLSSDCPNRVEEYFAAAHAPTHSCTWHKKENGRLVTEYPELYREWALKTHTTENLNINTDTVKKISFPQQGDFFYISDAIPLTDQQISFTVMGFRPGEMVEYYINNELVGRFPFPQAPLWQLRRGDFTLMIKQAGQLIDKLAFIVR